MYLRVAPNKYVAVMVLTFVSKHQTSSSLTFPQDVSDGTGPTDVRGREEDCHNDNKTRSVNLNLKTIFEVGNNESFLDEQLINKVQGLLERLKIFVHTTRSIRRSGADYTAAHTNQTFTEFIRNVVTTLQTYNDEDLEEVITVFDDEVRKYHYRGCRFYELVENYDIRREIADKLDQLKTKRAEDIKQTLDELFHKLKNKDSGLVVKMIIVYLNSLYTQEDSLKFNKFLHNLTLYKRKSERANFNLVDIIRTGLRSIVFDHYTNLDHEQRSNLKMKLETFWKMFYGPTTTHSNVWRQESVPIVRSKVIVPKGKSGEKLSASNYEKRHTSTTRKPAQLKLRKIKKIEQNNNVEKQYVTEKIMKTERTTEKRKRRRSTGRAKFSFITFYPETTTSKHKHKRLKPTTVTKQHQLSTHDIIKKHKLYTMHRANEHDGLLIRSTSEREHVVVSKPSRTKSIDPEPDYGTSPDIMGKMRFDVVTRTSIIDGTTKSYRTTKDRGKAMKFQDAPDDRITFTAESSEGMDIEPFESSFSEEAKSYRNSNDNDTLLQTNVATTQSSSERANDNSNYIKRIRDLEKELNEVKNQYVHTVKNDSDSLEQQHFEFWDGTRKPAVITRTTIKPSKPPKSITTLQPTEQTTTEETTTKTTTEAATNIGENMSDTFFFRGRSNKSSEDSYVTRKTTVKPASVAMDLVKLKESRGDTSKKCANSKSKKDYHNSGDNEIVKALDSDENAIRDVTRDFEFGNYVVGDMNDGEVKQKSKKVLQMIMDDLKTIMPDERENERAATEPVSTNDVDNTDLLKIFDEGGDIMK